MNKKAIDSLLEAKRQIDDTITQLIRENETEGKGIMSTLEHCGLVEVDDYLIFPAAFLEWCTNNGFLETEEVEFDGGFRSFMAHKYVSKNDLINLDKNGSVTVHPSLLYVYLNSGKNV